MCRLQWDRLSRASGSSTHRLHQAATGIGIVVIILRASLQNGIEAKCQEADGTGDQAETALEATTDVDQLAHEAM